MFVIVGTAVGYWILPWITPFLYFPRLEAPFPLPWAPQEAILVRLTRVIYALLGAGLGVIVGRDPTISKIFACFGGLIVAALGFVLVLMLASWLTHFVWYRFFAGPTNTLVVSNGLTVVLWLLSVAGGTTLGYLLGLSLGPRSVQ